MSCSKLNNWLYLLIIIKIKLLTKCKRLQKCVFLEFALFSQGLPLDKRCVYETVETRPLESICWVLDGNGICYILLRSSDYNWQRQEAFKCQDRVEIITKPLESASSCVSSALGCLVTGVIEQLSRIGKPITLSMKNAGGWLIFWHDHHLRLRLLEDPEIKIPPLAKGSLPKKTDNEKGGKKKCCQTARIYWL